jgi:hypothetical protein
VHVLQQVWDLCHADDSDDCCDEDTATDQALMMEVLAATSSSPPARAILFSGSVQGRPVTILVDSGSSCSFLSESLAAHLSGGVQLANPPKVRIADGTLVPCSVGFQALKWMVQDTEFELDFLVMPLPFYDIILGMDWLASHSPMQIDWEHKWLVLPYEQSIVRL